MPFRHDASRSLRFLPSAARSRMGKPIAGGRIRLISHFSGSGLQWCVVPHPSHFIGIPAHATSIKAYSVPKHRQEGVKIARFRQSDPGHRHWATSCRRTPVRAVSECLSRLDCLEHWMDGWDLLCFADRIAFFFASRARWYRGPKRKSLRAIMVLSFSS